MDLSREFRDVWKELERGLGAGVKFRIIKYLLLNPERTFTKYAVTKATGLKTKTVEYQLRTLVKMGWVKKYRYTPATYQANLENEVVKCLHDLFQKVKNIR
jgi:Fic family protein